MVEEELRKVRPEPVEAIKEVVVQNNPRRVVKIGSELPEAIKKNLRDFLVEYKDVFAWSVLDTSGISREVIEHKLSISPKVKLVVQKKRNLGKERSEVVGCDVKNLLDLGFIREVCFPKWFANVVMVKKSSTKQRMCGD